MSNFFLKKCSIFISLPSNFLRRGKKKKKAPPNLLHVVLLRASSSLLSIFDKIHLEVAC